VTSQWTQTSLHQWCTEASDLGLKPGQSIGVIDLPEVGVMQPFWNTTEREGEVISWWCCVGENRYEIFND
jgi:hypothetical protein